MYKDDSLSSLDRKRTRSFLKDEKRREKVERNIILQQMIEEEKEKLAKMRKDLQVKKR